MGLVSAVCFVLLTLASKNVLADSASSVGLLIAFYYGLTGFACVWYYRKHLQGRNLLTKGVLPGLGGLMLLAAFVLLDNNHHSANEWSTVAEQKARVETLVTRAMQIACSVANSSPASLLRCVA